jgi:hypothetical protein
MTHQPQRPPGHRWLERILLVSFFAFSFFSYLTFDFEHPPSHTSGGATQCECAGDDAPDPGSMPGIHIPPSSELVLCLPVCPELLSNASGRVPRETPDLVPRLLLHALPPPVLLI